MTKTAFTVYGDLGNADLMTAISMITEMGYRVSISAVASQPKRPAEPKQPEVAVIHEQQLHSSTAAKAKPNRRFRHPDKRSGIDILLSHMLRVKHTTYNDIVKYMVSEGYSRHSAASFMASLSSAGKITTDHITKKAWVNDDHV